MGHPTGRPADRPEVDFPDAQPTGQDRSACMVEAFQQGLGRASDRPADRPDSRSAAQSDRPDSRSVKQKICPASFSFLDHLPDPSVDRSADRSKLKSDRPEGVPGRSEYDRFMSV